MRKIITLFDGEGDPFLLQETGEGKISVAFLLEENPLLYAYFSIASRLLHMPNTIKIRRYNITPLNQETEDLPMHLQFEALLLFYTNPKLAVKFFSKLQKSAGWPLSYDKLDYYLLSSVTPLEPSEVILVSDDDLVTVNNKELLKLFTLDNKLVTIELNKYLNGEEYNIQPSSINLIQTYPIDYIYKDGLVYEFNYYTGKLKELGELRIKDNGKLSLKTKLDTVLLIGDELLIYDKDNTTLDELVDLEFLDDKLVLYGRKGVYQLSSHMYRRVFTKPTSNYFLTRFLIKNFDKSEFGVQIKDIIIPYRYNKKINPLCIMRLQDYINSPNNFVKNYSYSIITTPI